jgi:hypothetical protein
LSPSETLRYRCADFAFADDVSWTDRLRYTSDSGDSEFAAASPDEPFYVVRVAVPRQCCGCLVRTSLSQPF